MAEIIRAAQISEHPRRMDGQTGALLGPSSIEVTSGAASDATDSPQQDLAEVAELRALQDAVDDARERAAAAEGRLAELEADLAAQSEEGRREGFEQGREEGLDVARHEAEASLLEELERIRGIAKDADAGYRERLEQRVEDSVVEIVCTAVSKIVGDAAADPANVTAIVGRMLREVEHSDSVVIRLCPADYKILIDANGGLPDSLDSSHLTFVSDERVECGGCLIETEAGELDGRLETQLRRFNRVMLETRRQMTAGGRVSS